MGRVRQPAGHKGSLRWIQKLVNEHANVLDGAIGSGPIDDKLNVKLSKVPLPKFWPARGPQWDALGCAQFGEVILVEAKAHVSEIMSSGDPDLEGPRPTSSSTSELPFRRQSRKLRPGRT